MFTNDEIYDCAKYLGIDFSKFSFEELVTGVTIELEHGLINQKTNVTNDMLLPTMKIALAHLNEFPNYYNKDYGLAIFEKYLKNKLN